MLQDHPAKEYSSQGDALIFTAIPHGAVTLIAVLDMLSKVLLPVLFTLATAIAPFPSPTLTDIVQVFEGGFIVVVVEVEIVEDTDVGTVVIPNVDLMVVVDTDEVEEVVREVEIELVEVEVLFEVDVPLPRFTSIVNAAEQTLYGFVVAESVAR